MRQILAFTVEDVFLQLAGGFCKYSTWCYSSSHESMQGKDQGMQAMGMSVQDKHGGLI